MSARILVVDDEANIRALIDEILSEEGYDVTTAADAKEARSARKRQDFDLVLLDIWMPDTDGISLLREWSEGGATGTVVMMSGHGTVDTAVEATRLGAVDFVEKPVSLAKLLRTVERALAVRRTKGERRGVSVQNAVPAGKSQAIRLPKEYRFQGTKVYVKRMGNAVVLIPEHDSWQTLVESLATSDSWDTSRRIMSLLEEVPSRIEEVVPRRCPA